MNSDLRSISILDAPVQPRVETAGRGERTRREMDGPGNPRGLVQRLGAIDAGKVEVNKARRASSMNCPSLSDDFGTWVERRLHQGSLQELDNNRVMRFPDRCR